MNLYRLIYQSSANPNLKLRDYLTLVERAEEANRERQLTGLLVLCHEHFVQVLEGDRDTVYTLFRKIENDQRHSQVKLIDFEPLEARTYDGWGMTLVRLDELKCHSDCLRLFGIGDEEESRRLLPEDFVSGLDLIYHELIRADGEEAEASMTS